MNERFKNFFILFIIFLSILFIYLSFLSAAYDFDSISLAQWAEKSIYLVPSQQFHLLNYVFNNLFYQLWCFCGYAGSALLPLQVLDAFFGAAAVVVFFRILQRLIGNKFFALTCALGLGFSAEFWHYATEAETHIISIFFLLVSIDFLVKTILSGKTSARFIGFFHALATFSSAAYITFFPFFLITFICLNRPRAEKVKLCQSYLVSLCVFWLIPYTAIGFLVGLQHSTAYFSGGILPGIKHFAKEMIFWFKSHERFSVIASKEISYIAQNFTKILFGYTENPIPGLSLFFFSAAFLGLNYRPLFKERALFALTVASFFMFILFISIFFIYEPFNTQRYTPLLIFFWLVISICMYLWVSLVPIRIIPLLFFFLVVANGIGNFWSYIYPASIPEKNYYLMQSGCIREKTNPEDLILIIGKNNFGYPEFRVRYLEYFSNRRFFELGYLNCRFYDIFQREGTREELFEFLRHKIESILDNQHRVFLIEEVLSIPVKKKPTMSTLELTYDDIVDFLQKTYQISPRHTCAYRFFPQEMLYVLTRKNYRN